jgi:hypothetical protein
LQASRFDSKQVVRGMLVVETIARIRREHFIKGKTIKEICPGSEGVPEHGPQGVAVGRDGI